VALAGGALFVASSSDGRVYVKTPAATTAVRTGRSPVALAADARRVVVADSRDGTLTTIDARTHQLVGRPVRVGGALVDVALAGDTAWVADAANGDVVDVDLRSGRVIGDVAVGRRPVAVAPAGHDLYALSERGLLRIRDGKVASTRAAGADPVALAVDDHYVWVASGNTVLRFDR
jgi:DNA-binding beta-propeller fold protein YncE